MGNFIGVVQCYRLNKDHGEKKRKKNICNYLYGKYYIKDVSSYIKPNPLLRKKEDSKNL